MVAENRTGLVRRFLWSDVARRATRSRCSLKLAGLALPERVPSLDVAFIVHDQAICLALPGREGPRSECPSFNPTPSAMLATAHENAKKAQCDVADGVDASRAMRGETPRILYFDIPAKAPTYQI
jgi:hypothetical protein